MIISNPKVLWYGTWYLSGWLSSNQARRYSSNGANCWHEQELHDTVLGQHNGGVSQQLVKDRSGSNFWPKLSSHTERSDQLILPKALCSCSGHVLPDVVDGGHNCEQGTCCANPEKKNILQQASLLHCYVFRWDDNIYQVYPSIPTCRSAASTKAAWTLVKPSCRNTQLPT